MVACSEKPPSEACLHLSAQALFDEPNWTFMDARASQIANQMHEDNRSFMLTPALGKYEGAESVREYIAFVSTLSPFMESNPVINPQTGSGMVVEYDREVVAPNGETTSHTMCSWVSMSL